MVPLPWKRASHPSVKGLPSEVRSPSLSKRLPSFGKGIPIPCKKGPTSLGKEGPIPRKSQHAINVANTFSKPQGFAGSLAHSHRCIFLRFWLFGPPASFTRRPARCARTPWREQRITRKARPIAKHQECRQMLLHGVVNDHVRLLFRCLRCVKGLTTGIIRCLSQLKGGQTGSIEVPGWVARSNRRQQLQCRWKGQALSRPRHHQMQWKFRVYGQAFGEAFRRPSDRYQTQRKCPLTGLTPLTCSKHRQTTCAETVRYILDV